MTDETEPRIRFRPMPGFAKALERAAAPVDKPLPLLPGEKLHWEPYGSRYLLTVAKGADAASEVMDADSTVLDILARVPVVAAQLRAALAVEPQGDG